MLIEYILIMFEHVLLMYFYDLFLESSKDKIILKILLSFVSSFILFLVSFSNDYSVLFSNIMPFLCLIMYGLIIGVYKIKKIVIYSTISIFNLVIINSLFLIMLSLIEPDIANSLISFGYISQIWLIIISKVFLFFETLYLYRYKSSVLKFDKSVWIWINFFSICSVFVILMTLKGLINNNISYFYSVIICVIIIIFNLSVYRLCYTISKSFQENIETKLELAIMKHEEVEAKQMENKAKEIAKLRHDFNKHLNAIRFYVNNNEGIEKINKYIDELYVDGLDIFKTNSKVLNFILGTKVSEARSKDITANFMITGSNTDFISDVDYTKLFGNLLDNAIEACVRTNKKGLIFCQVEFDDAYCKVKISNSSLPVARGKFGNLVTSKSDSKNHGIGMSAIVEVVEKYNGEYDYNYSNGFFTFSCILSNIKEFG